MKAVVKQYDLDLLSILPRVIVEITEFVSSEAGKSALAVYKRVSNFLSSNKQLLSFEKKISKERATKEDQLVQEQLTLTKEQVEENLQSKDFKTALFVLGPLLDSVNQFLDNVQVNCEDDEIRDLRHALLNEICQTMDRVLVFSELDKK